MTQHTLTTRILALALFGLAWSAVPARAQFAVDGDFRVRWYSDSFSLARDNREKESYMRYLARVRGKIKASKTTSFFAEAISLIDNNGQPMRNLAGTGPMKLGLSQLYAEMTAQNFLVFDVARLRVGRQQFPIGDGLSMGDSYYFLDKFDGARVDLSYGICALSVFGAITGQTLSSSGLYPDPGSDQIYAARLSADVARQNVMAYYLLQRPRGLFNDSYVIGGGASGEVLLKDLEYSCEGAWQKSNTPAGLPKKEGLGYMGGASYRFAFGPFRSIKVESRYAAYQGDDASTPGTVERFSPPYPSFFWGSRVGYVNGDVGGDYPRNNQNLEGSRMWYSRLYVIPSLLPKLRLQVQYIKVREYVDNDGYNSMDDEFSVRAYYTLSPQSQLQVRYSRVIPNGGDRDIDGSGSIGMTEDRIFIDSFMLEWQIKF